MNPEPTRGRRLAALAVVVPLALVGATQSSTRAEAARPPVLTPHVLPQPEGWRVELVHLAEDGAVLGRGFPSGRWVEDEPTYVLAWGEDLSLRNLGLGEPVDIEAHQVAFNRDQRAYRVGLDGSGGLLPLPSGAASSSVADLDTAGNALGAMVDLAGHSHAVLWPRSGAMIDLGAPGEDSSGLRLAPDGAVIGTSSDAGYAWAWRREASGAVSPLYVRPGRARSGLLPVPFLISPSGSAMVHKGGGTTGAEYDVPRVWTSKRGDVGVLDGDSTGAMGWADPVDVNDAGVVVGCVQDEWWDDDVTFRWHPTRGLIGKREMGCMTSVNAAGDSVGSGYFDGRLWRWRGVGMQELTVEGQQFLSAAQINDAGLVAAEDRTDHSAYEFRLVLWR